VQGTVGEELVGKDTVSACLPGVVFPGHGEVRAEDLWVSPRCECCVVEEGGGRDGFLFIVFVDVAEGLRGTKGGGRCWARQDGRAEGVSRERGQGLVGVIWRGWGCLDGECFY
jgi:hypothetical protein